MWASNLRTFDSEYRISAAYLAPNATEFAPAEDLGSGDDRVSILHAHGVSMSGEVAVDACGIRDGVLQGASESCVSGAANPQGVLESNESERGDARTFYAAFDAGIAAFDCDDDVLGLRFPGSSEAEPFIPIAAIRRACRASNTRSPWSSW